MVKNIANTAADQAEMVQAIGVASSDELFQDIPAHLRKPSIDVPAARSEIGISRYLRTLAEQNADCEKQPVFLGAGAYHHFVPAVVPYLTSRGEFASPYTPYQPEVSQGTLQSIFEFQTLVCRLTGMEVANASLYDGATAVTEAAVLATAVTKRRRIVVAGGLHPEYKQVLHTHLAGRDVEIVDGVVSDPPWGGQGTTSVEALAKLMDDQTAGLIVQNPNFFGNLEDLAELGRIAHAVGALFTVCAYPIALGLLQPPAAYDADVVVAEGQSLGNSLNYGGPYLGLFATKAKYMRYVPGRFVGATTDDRGQTGYVLTLQTREQHIRREKASSNVCTNEALCALATTIYLSVMGPQGLREVASQCLRKAHYLAEQIQGIPGFELAFPAPFFNEFTVKCPVPPADLNRRLLDKGIIGGLELGTVYPELSDMMLLCVTEMNSHDDMETLLQVMRESVEQSGRSVKDGGEREGEYA